MATNKNIKINLDYSQFQGGMSKCQSTMKQLTAEFKMQQAALGNNASEVDQLKVKHSTLTKQIEVQTQVVELASQKFNALSESEGASATQVDRARTAYTNQITKLYELTNQAEQVSDKLHELADAEEEVGDSASDAAGSTENLAMVITSTVAIVSQFTSAISQVVSAVVEAARASSEWADDLATMSAQIGVSTQTLQEWAYAANFTDTSLQTMESSMSRLTKQMAEAQNGSTSAQAAFSGLGVSVTNADGSLRSAESVFYDVIDALGEIPNKAEQDAAAMAIFGKSAQELTGLIEAGSDGLRAYGEEAQNLGVILSGSQVESLNQMQDAFDRFNAVIEASSNRIMANFVPAITTITNAFSTMNPAVIDSVNVVSSMLQMYASLAPTLSHTATIINTLRTAKVAATAATTVETSAEVMLGTATAATNAQLLVQLGYLALFVAAAVAAAAIVVNLVYWIEDLVDGFKEYKKAADEAAESTTNFANAASGTESSNGTSSGTKHYALGGRVSGGRSVWVGEQGAELVDLPAGSYVHNTTETNQISNGGNVTNITVNVDHISELQELLNISQRAKQRARMGVVTV